MHALEFAGRHLSPTALPQIIEAMAGRDDEVTAALAASRALDWPERLKPVRACLEPAAEAAAAGIAGLRSAGEAPQPIVAAYRALRNYAQAAQAIYPMAAFLRAGQPVLPGTVGARRCGVARPPGGRRSGAREGGRDACRRPAGHARRLLALCAGDLRRRPRLSAGGGAARRQRQWRRLPVELGPRGAHARLHRAGADGDRLDLVADGPRHRRPQHRPHGRSGRRRVEHRCRPAASDRHERRRHLQLRAGRARAAAASPIWRRWRPPSIP